MGMRVRDGHVTTVQGQICPGPCLIGLRLYGKIFKLWPTMRIPYSVIHCFFVSAQESLEKSNWFHNFHKYRTVHSIANCGSRCLCNLSIPIMFQMHRWNIFFLHKRLQLISCPLWDEFNQEKLVWSQLNQKKFWILAVQTN